MEQLDCILAHWEPGQSCTMFSGTGGLPEPPLWPGNKSSMAEGPLKHQVQVLVCSLPLTSSSSSGSLGQQLPTTQWQAPSEHELQTAVAKAPCP